MTVTRSRNRYSQRLRLISAANMRPSTDATLSVVFDGSAITVAAADTSDDPFAAPFATETFTTADIFELSAARSEGSAPVVTLASPDGTQTLCISDDPADADLELFLSFAIDAYAGTARF